MRYWKFILQTDGGLLNTFLFAFEDRRARLDAIVRGYRLGQRAQPFFGVRWDELWARPLAEVRRELGVESEPDAGLSVA